MINDLPTAAELEAAKQELNEKYPTAPVIEEKPQETVQPAKPAAVEVKKADAEKSAFQWRNLIVWLIGFVIYRVLMHVDTPVGNTLPDMVITVIVCVIVEKIAAAVKEK